MDELEPRVRAVCDLNVAEAREYGGRHEYDGVPQDLSLDGVAAGLARLAAARDGRAAQDDAHDEAHLRAFEDLQRVVYADLELHRRNPMFHLGELDLACYDKDYAPAAERHAARAAHLAAWPAVIDAAIGSLDSVPSPVAASLIGGIRGLAAGTRPPRRISGWSPTSSRPRSTDRRTPRSAQPRSPRCSAPPRRSMWTSASSPPGPTPNGTGCARGWMSRPRLSTPSARPWTWPGNW
jgi:hypothetical protein